MSSPFRERRFRPVPAALRPRRSRSAVRVIITDGTSVLLLSDTDPGLPGSGWWLTPGGGIDPGEDSRAAAVREVAEETGLVVAPGRLLGPIARRFVVHGYSDQILSQEEDFFLLLVDAPFEAVTHGFTASEQLTVTAIAWHPLAELDQLALPVWPANLAELAGLAQAEDRWPIDLGDIEESTLAVG